MNFSETRRHQEGKPLTGAVENMRRLGLIRPRDCVPSPSLRGPPAAGRQRVFVGANSLCRRTFSGLSVVACHCGVQRTGTCSRLSPPVPGSRSEQGHTCRTLRGTGSVSSGIKMNIVVHACCGHFLHRSTFSKNSRVKRITSCSSAPANHPLTCAVPHFSTALPCHIPLFFTSG